MIKLTYSVTCNNCKLEHTKEISFASVEIMLYNPKAKQLTSPALPLGWLTEAPRTPHELEKHFCSVQCKKEFATLLHAPLTK